MTRSKNDPQCIWRARLIKDAKEKYFSVVSRGIKTRKTIWWCVPHHACCRHKSWANVQFGRLSISARMMKCCHNEVKVSRRSHMKCLAGNVTLQPETRNNSLFSVTEFLVPDNSWSHLLQNESSKRPCRNKEACWEVGRVFFKLTMEVWILGWITGSTNFWMRFQCQGSFYKNDNNNFGNLQNVSESFARNIVLHAAHFFPAPRREALAGTFFAQQVISVMLKSSGPLSRRSRPLAWLNVIAIVCNYGNYPLTRSTLAHLTQNSGNLVTNSRRSQASCNWVRYRGAGRPEALEWCHAPAVIRGGRGAL